MSIDEIDPLWNLADTFSVTDAAALIAGSDPAHAEDGDARIHVVFSALRNAINAGRLKAVIRHDLRISGWDERPGDGEEWSLATPGREEAEDAQLSKAILGVQWIRHIEPDWGKTTIDRQDLVDWLTSRGFRTGFFFPTATDAPDYLDPGNPRYAPKLAAAVRAWQAVTDSGQKSPKQALEKWLREHAAEFGLADDNGNPISQAVGDCSKVANWQPGGGAPKTPGG
jgi:hypothetical protein